MAREVAWFAGCGVSLLKPGRRRWTGVEFCTEKALPFPLECCDT